MTDLKSCPFCGGMPKYWDKRRRAVFCVCLAGPGVYADTADKAAELWNRRASRPDSELVKALRWAGKQIKGPTRRIPGQNDAFCDAYDAFVAALASVEPRGE